MIMIGAILLLVSLLGIFLGLIKPSLVIWWGTNKTRFKVLLIYGLMFFLSIFFAALGAPSNLEVAKTSVEEKDYEKAMDRLEKIKSTDPDFAEAQKLLPETRKNYLISRFDDAVNASVAGEHTKVVTLLTDYPEDGPGSIDAAKMLVAAKDAIAEAELVKAEKLAQREAQEKADAIAREQERAMADFPECGSEEAQTEVARVLEGAPLGRVFGLSLIKIKNAKQVSGSASGRSCTGTAHLNNAKTYPMTYRFYRDENDVMIEAQVLGLGQ